MTAYDAAEWSELFVATTGASAALLGLLFVAVSINLERILAYAGLPERALETMMLLLAVLIVSIAGLIPGQSHVPLGIELLLVGIAMTLIALRLPIVLDDGSGREPLSWKLSRWSIRLAAIVPITIAGLSVLLEGGGGLYWLVAGIVFATIGAVAGAWVLMVEILR